MATKTTKRPKARPVAAELEAAPVGWLQLLEEAIEKPGTISRAFTMFHQYSLGNAMLVLWECGMRGLPLGPVAPYSKWQALGRQVKKGQRALMICMPKLVRFKRTDKETGDEVPCQVVKFVYRPVVFVYAQTEPIEGKEDRSATLTTQTGADWDRDRAMQALGLTFGEFRQLDGNLAGFFRPATRSIHLNPVGLHQDRTLVHEMAHSILHEGGYAGCESRGVAEVEAECVALLVSEALGLGGADAARGYIQHWLRTTDHEALTETMVRRIFACAQRLIAAGRPQASQEEAA
jgi:antirestriction protein ArdC